MSPSLRTCLVALVVVGASLTACEKGGRITASGEASTVPPSTTTTTTIAGRTTTTGPGGGLGGGLGGGSTPGSTTVDAAPADETSTDESWSASPGEYRGQDGLRVAYVCPPDGTLSTVWGTDPFTDDSSVCTAAVFAGLITTTDGGRVVIEISTGASEYATGTANGVTTEDYGVWAGSFTFG